MTVHKDHYDSPELARKKAREALGPRNPALEVLETHPTRRFMARFGLPGFTILMAAAALIWPFLNDAEVSFTLSKEQTTTSDGRVMMTNLRYSGVDQKDRLFIVEAEEGEQEDPAAKRVRLSAITANFDIENGKEANLEAREGLYRITEEQLSLTGDVTLTSQDAIELRMAGAEIDLAEKTAYGQGDVTGKLGLGQISADEVEFVLPEKRGVFKGRVKILINPSPTSVGPGTADVEADGSQATESETSS